MSRDAEISSKQPLKKKTFECHLPPTLLVHLQPETATHLPLPLRYNGSSPEGPSVRAKNRKHTKVGIQTSIPLSYVALRLTHISPLHIEKQQIQTLLWIRVCVCVCVHARVCLCLIGIVSISKGPDSHPPSPCETKAGQLMMPWMSLDQLSHVYERQAASVRDTVNVLPLEVLRVAALNTGICWLNYWWHWRMISVNKWDHCEHLSDTSGIVNASVSQD